MLLHTSSTLYVIRCLPNGNWGDNWPGTCTIDRIGELSRTFGGKIDDTDVMYSLGSALTVILSGHCTSGASVSTSKNKDKMNFENKIDQLKKIQINIDN